MAEDNTQQNSENQPSVSLSPSLQALYFNTTREYRAFFQKVREAFNGHCDELKEQAEAKLDALKPDDKEGRKEVLLWQKEQLDQALAELKQLIANESSKMRKTLEEIRRKQEEQTFDLENELSQIAA